MSDEGLAMVGNDLGFFLDDQFSWENLPNDNSGNSSAGGEEEENKTVGGNKNLGPDGGTKSNYKKSGEGPASNKKRSRGGGCKKKNSNNNKPVEQGNNNNNNNDNNNNNNDNKVGGSGESDHEIHIWTERERRKKMRNMFANLHALLPQLPAKADKSTIVDEAVTYIKVLEHTLEELQKQKLDKLHGASSSPSSTTTTTTTSALACDPSSSMAVPQQTTISREAFLADHQGSFDGLVAMGMNNNNNNNDNINTNSLQLPAAFQTWTWSNVVLNVSGNDAHISVCSPRKPGLLGSICCSLEKNNISLVSAQVSSNVVRAMYMIHAHANPTGATDQFLEAFNPVEEVFKQAVGEIMFWITS